MTKKVKAAVVNPTPALYRFAPLLLILVTFLLYANTIGNGYNMDDELVTRKHKFTSKGISAIKDIVTNPYYSDAMGYAYGYRPLVHVSFAIEHQFFGEGPHTSHFFNLLLYVICVWLFFRLLKMWTGENGLPLAVTITLLFALHPVHTEVVASIKNRDEILALLFGLACGISFTKNLRQQSWGTLIVSALWLALALLAKKSIYPLALIYPLVGSLLYRPKLSQILFYSSFLILPASIITSEFRWDRMLLLVTVPYAVILMFELGRRFTYQIWAKFQATYIKRKYLAWALFLFSITALVPAFLEGDMLWLIISFLCGAVFVTISTAFALPFFSIWFVLSGTFFPSSPLLIMSTFLASYYVVESYLAKDKKNLWISIICWVLVEAALLFENFSIGPIIVGIAPVLLFFTARKKIGYIFLVLLQITTIIIFKEFSISNVAMSVMCVYYFPYRKIINIQWKAHFLTLGLVISGMSFISITYFWNHRADVSQETTSIANERQQIKLRTSKLQEGRNLEFAENTLTVPHSRGEKIGTGAVTLGEYLKLMVFPQELSFYYGYARTDTVGMKNPWTWVSLFVHLGLLFLAFWQIKKRPFIFIGVIWYLLSIGLFSNWVELVAGMVGERLAFSASAGFCIFVMSIVVWVKPNLSLTKPGTVEIVLGVVCIAFAFRTITRNTDWKDKLTLMGNDIGHLENSAQANNLYALSLMQESFENKRLRPEQQMNMRKLAVLHFDQAVKIWPDFFNAAYDKGRSAMSLGDYESAIAGFEKAISIKRDGVFFDPYYQLSNLYLQTGRYLDYLNNARELLRIDVNNPEPYNRLARGFYLNNQRDSALFFLRTGIMKFPSDKSLPQNMVEIWTAEGNLDSASYYRSKYIRP